jgi:hypothetical protein
MSCSIVAILVYEYICVSGLPRNAAAVESPAFDPFHDFPPRISWMIDQIIPTLARITLPYTGDESTAFPSAQSNFSVKTLGFCGSQIRVICGIRLHS